MRSGRRIAVFAGLTVLAVPLETSRAMTMIGALSPALPPAVAPGMGFPGAVAPGWHFAQADFVDPGYRDPDPAVPSLRGYDARFTAPPLAIGTLDVVAAVAPRLLSQDEAIASIAWAHGGLDAEALGVFDIASAQVFTKNSVTIGGGEFGRRYTFKFAGQIGASSDE